MKTSKTPKQLGILAVFSLFLCFLLLHPVHNDLLMDQQQQQEAEGGTSATDDTPSNLTQPLQQDILEGLSATMIDGEVIDDLSKAYGDRVLLVVNVASKCRYTDVNYRELSAIQKKYGRYLTVLAFPCNQGGQEPGSLSEIAAFAKSKKANFQLFQKVEVNGRTAHPLFKQLKAALEVKNIPWNFGKFLIGKNGQPLRFFDQTVPFEVIRRHIATAVKAAAPREDSHNLSE